MGIQEQYDAVRLRERAWRAPAYVPGVEPARPVKRPLPLTESQLNALHHEAIELGRLSSIEGATYIILNEAGQAIELVSQTRWEENVSSINTAQMVHDTLDAGGKAVIILHNHLVPEPGEACEPSADDRSAIPIIESALQAKGLQLQDFVIVGRPSTIPWTWRESIADGTSTPSTSPSKPPSRHVSAQESTDRTSIQIREAAAAELRQALATIQVQYPLILRMHEAVDACFPRRGASLHTVLDEIEREGWLP